MINLDYKKDGGFALIFAILVSVILISVGVAISNIAEKEVRLSAFTEKSRMAFYSADAGIECALYADVHKGKFETAYNNNDVIFSCFGKDLKADGNTGGNSNITRTYNTSIIFDTGCAYIIIKKEIVVGLPELTTITSYGRNKIVNGICGVGKDSVERALQARF